MSKLNWTINNIPDQTGKVIVITGATSGLGKEAARVLAGKNAKVIVAVRNMAKGDDVAEEIRQQFPNADIEVSLLDLSSQASVKAFAIGFNKSHDSLDVLINNAGIMMCPYSKTEDGFEIQMGTNHLGHFALTGYLMPLLKNTKGSRIVATSSIAHRTGNLDFSDLNWENRKYGSARAYADSKLANLYFVHTLVSKSEKDLDYPRVTSAHPGWTRSELQRYTGVVRFLNPLFSQGPDMGVLPTLRAAFDPNAQPGDCFGPANFFELRGYPVKVKSTPRSHNTDSASKLWEISETLTGVIY